MYHHSIFVAFLLFPGGLPESLSTSTRATTMSGKPFINVVYNVKVFFFSFVQKES
jgi:hypothetical protein